MQGTFLKKSPLDLSVTSKAYGQFASLAKTSYKVTQELSSLYSFLYKKYKIYIFLTEMTKTTTTAAKP